MLSADVGSSEISQLSLLLPGPELELWLMVTLAFSALDVLEENLGRV